MDDFPAFYAGLSSFALGRRERQIAQLVDVIWTSSSELKSRWKHVHNEVHLVHNGLDISAIDAVIPTQKASQIKTFGYIGTIASWFDWRFVYSLAEKRPTDEICLIGPVYESPAGKLPSNVKLLPACNHHTAMQSMMQFDVGLIPFKKNRLTSSVDPIKYYEYRALGLPVISTSFGEMRLRAGEPGLFISQSPDDVSNVVESAIQFHGNKNKDSIFATQNSWEARFDAALRISPKLTRGSIENFSANSKQS